VCPLQAPLGPPAAPPYAAVRSVRCVKPGDAFIACVAIVSAGIVVAIAMAVVFANA